MAWTPRHDHVSQLNPATGSGENNCWQASLTRYLFEAQLVDASRSAQDVINEVSIYSRGYPSHPGNPYTTFDQAEASLAHYGIPIHYTYSYPEAANTFWSIVYVDGRHMVPDTYPDSYFHIGAPDPEGNHFALWLPLWNGSGSWFNNPLSVDKQDHEQSMDAFYGAYLLPQTGNGETSPERRKATQECGLKPQAAHGGQNILTIPEDGQLIDSGITKTTDDVWAWVQYTSHYGYIPRQYIVDL
jgi:hypothetical protein